MTLPVVVLAGGLGTRIRHVTGEHLPKALVPVHGRPFVDHKLEELRAAGITDVVMLVGHGANAVETHVGDGSAFGLRVRYQTDGASLLGTGGAVRQARGLLGPAFFVTYGDTLLDVPVPAVEDRLLSGPCDGVMTVLQNDDRWETSNVDLEGGLVLGYAKPAAAGIHRFLDYGFLAFRAVAFDSAPKAPFDLGVVIKDLVTRRAMAAVVVDRRFYDIGNEGALRETEAYLAARERS